MNTLPETNSLHLKIDGWKLEDYTLVWGPAYFQVRTMSFRGGKFANPQLSEKKSGKNVPLTVYIRYGQLAEIRSL